MEFNPYQSPEAISGDEPTNLTPKAAAKFARTARNIRAICILYLVFGSLFTLMIPVSFMPPEPGQPPLTLWHRVFFFTAGVAGCAGAVSAFGMLRRKPWGIAVCKALSALYLLNFPSERSWGDTSCSTSIR